MSPKFHVIPHGDEYPDGYTMDGYIAEIEGMWPALAFKYRPMIPEQKMHTQTALEKADTVGKGAAIITKVISTYVREWDAVDVNDNPVEVTIDSVRHLWVGLQQQIYLIVIGASPSDVVPDPTDKQVEEDADVELQAVIEGKDPAEINEDTNIKN